MGNAHGVDKKITTSKRGSVPVYVYAPNAAGTPGGNILLQSSTVTVTAGPLTAPTPKVSGSPKVGVTLKAVTGTWAPSGVTLKYQWRADGKVISGATKSSYKVPATATGKRLSVSVTGVKSGYLTATKKSAATAIVRK